MQKARYVAALGIPLLALLSFTLVAAWSGPPSSPPNGNVAPPINVGATDQVKDGKIGVGGLVVFGNSLFGGSANSNAYLNFGATSGSSGYGIRDNNGLIEFKNSSSTWQSIQSILWTLCGGTCGNGSSEGRIGGFISEEQGSDTGGNKTYTFAIPSNAAYMQVEFTCNATAYAGSGSWVKYSMDGGGSGTGCYAVSGTNISIFDTKVIPITRRSNTLTITEHVDHYDGFGLARAVVDFYAP